MPAAKRVGVSDIAKHAGVSIGTVSNYLNYPERVSDTLKEKIGASINELAYQPHHHCSRQHLLPLLFTYSAAKQFPIPGVILSLFSFEWFYIKFYHRPIHAGYCFSSLH